jgi:hypothetical protein
MLRYPYWYSNLSHHYTPIDTAIYYLNSLLSIQQSITLLYSHWYSKLLIDTTTTPDFLLHHGHRLTPPKLLRTPMDAQAQAWQAGRNAQAPDQDYAMLCYLLCFVFCHVCYPISPDQDHKPRGRASDVSTISTCFLYVMIYCPLPHQSLWERLGVSLLCTCAAFSLLC